MRVTYLKSLLTKITCACLLIGVYSCEDLAPNLTKSEDQMIRNKTVSATFAYGSDAQPTSGENSNMHLGNPSNAQPTYIFRNNYLLDLKYYTISYDADRGTPNWVCWYINRASIAPNVPRMNNFAGYQDLPSHWYMVRHNSYVGSGFDRGHNCPSADRRSSVEANSATFLMINMIPQSPRNNQGVWANFESYLRSRVNEGNEVYIIMGSYGIGGIGAGGHAETIDQGRVTVPAQVYKIAVILPEGDNDLHRIENGEAEITAIDTPNINTVTNNWREYEVSVEHLEQATGYTFLSELSTEAQLSIKTSFRDAA